MIEVHFAPSCKPVSANYSTYINGSKQAAVVLSKVVFYEKKGMLENGMLGITYNVQISKNILTTKPGLKDILEIDGVSYKFINPQLKDQSLGIYPFWQSEVKTVVV
jgi:hypothetical protein